MYYKQINEKTFAQKCYEVFERSVKDYHAGEGDGKDAVNPYEAGTLEHELYEKNQVDLRQWHLEDEIRARDIEPVRALEIKRRIDELNQQRTAMVERLDDRFVEEFRNVRYQSFARLNTESLGWALDRLSIFAIRSYHLQEEVWRTEMGSERWNVIEPQMAFCTTQIVDLWNAIDQLRDDILAGYRRMPVYRQMKLYAGSDTKSESRQNEGQK